MHLDFGLRMDAGGRLWRACFHPLKVEIAGSNPARLHALYPDRNMVVEVFAEPVLGAACVVFYESMVQTDEIR